MTVVLWAGIEDFSKRRAAVSNNPVSADHRTKNNESMGMESGEWSGEVRKRPEEEGTTSEGTTTSELGLRDSPVATPNAMPLTSARHSAVFSVWMVEELAGERDNGLCGIPSCDPSAFGARGRVVDDRTAAVGRGCGSP